MIVFGKQGNRENQYVVEDRKDGRRSARWATKETARSDARGKSHEDVAQEERGSQQIGAVECTPLANDTDANEQAETDDEPDGPISARGRESETRWPSPATE